MSPVDRADSNVILSAGERTAMDDHLSWAPAIRDGEVPQECDSQAKVAFELQLSSGAVGAA